MKLTNNLNLPEALYTAILNDDYDRGNSDYTATQLIQPVRITLLKEKHKDSLTEDVSEVLYRLYGKIVHKLLEDSATHNELVEKRFYYAFNGLKLSAQIDNLYLESGLLSDYKFTTYYGFRKNAKPKDEWVSQLNIQALFGRSYGYTIKNLQIVGILRDWKTTEANKSKTYPPLPVMTMEIPQLESEKIISYINSRLESLESGKQKLPECSSSDRWVQRDGFNMRCELYCPVKNYCDQYKEIKNADLQNP